MFAKLLFKFLYSPISWKWVIVELRFTYLQYHSIIIPFIKVILSSFQQG